MMEAIAELETIKWLLIAILAGMGIVAASALFMAYALWIGAKQLVDQNSGQVFKQIAEDHLAKNEIDELIEHVEERLASFPRDVWANWYMGQAKYFKGALPEAKRLFSRVAELEPSWREVAGAWIERIEDELAKGPSLVK